MIYSVFYEVNAGARCGAGEIRRPPDGSSQGPSPPAPVPLFCLDVGAASRFSRGGSSSRRGSFLATLMIAAIFALLLAALLGMASSILRKPGRSGDLGEPDSVDKRPGDPEAGAAPHGEAEAPAERAKSPGEID